MPDVDLSYAFGLAPEKAVEYFRAKGYAIGWDWRETLHEAHAKAFTVAKVMKMDVLHDIRAAVDKAIAKGDTLSEFKKGLIPTLQKKGWWGEVTNEQTGETAFVNARRLDTIYQTNLQTAYMTGRYRSMMENTADRPYWQYIAVMDGKTRPAHRALHGKIFRFDDPIWSYIYPPNGFRCRCRVRALSAADVKRMGVTVESSAGKLDFVEVSLGGDDTVTTVARYRGADATGKGFTFSPDAGWNYNPGRYEHQLDVSAWDKAKKEPPVIRKQFIDEMARTDVRDKVFSGWVNDVVRINKGLAEQGVATRLEGKIATAGWLDDDVVTWLAHKQGVFLETPVIVTTDKQIMHAERATKHNPVDVAALRQLSVIIQTAEIWLDPADNSLIFVTRDATGPSKYVVKTNDPVRRFGKLNQFITAQRINKGDFAAGKWEQIR
jgi:SPP1 gp7 family putative phage head morphogenesis protein